MKYSQLAFRLRSSDADAIYDTTRPPTIYLSIYTHIYIIRERISRAFLAATRNNVSHQTRRERRVFVHGDPVKGGRNTQWRERESSFDVTTYLLVDRPTHPYKQGLLERNRNNLYPKGLGSDRVSLGYYLPAVRLHTSLYAYTRVRATVTWLEHFRSTRTRGVCAFCVAFEESIDRGCLPLSFLLLRFPIGHREL